jgi:hypothetical protein
VAAFVSMTDSITSFPLASLTAMEMLAVTKLLDEPKVFSLTRSARRKLGGHVWPRRMVARAILRVPLKEPPSRGWLTSFHDRKGVANWECSERERLLREWSQCGSRIAKLFEEHPVTMMSGESTHLAEQLRLAKAAETEACRAYHRHVISHDCV